MSRAITRASHALFERMENLIRNFVNRLNSLKYSNLWINQEMSKTGLAFFSCIVKKVKMKFVDIVIYHEFKEKNFYVSCKEFPRAPMLSKNDELK